MSTHQLPDTGEDAQLLLAQIIVGYLLLTTSINSIVTAITNTMVKCRRRLQQFIRAPAVGSCLAILLSALNCNQIESFNVVGYSFSIAALNRHL